MATYVTGGLEPDQAQKLQKHTEECQECAEALEQMWTWDTHLLTAFGGAQPSSQLEEKAIRSVRDTILWRRARRTAGVIVAVAALFLFGVFGAFVVTALEGQSWLTQRAPKPERGFVGGTILAFDGNHKTSVEGSERERSNFGVKKVNDPNHIPSADALAKSLNQQLATYLARPESLPRITIHDDTQSTKEEHGGAGEESTPEQANQFLPEGFTSGLTPAGTFTPDLDIKTPPGGVGGIGGIGGISGIGGGGGIGGGAGLGTLTIPEYGRTFRGRSGQSRNPETARTKQTSEQEKKVYELLTKVKQEYNKARYDEAIKLAQKAKEIDPDSVTVNMAIKMANMARNKKAFDDIEKQKVGFDLKVTDVNPGTSDGTKKPDVPNLAKSPNFRPSELNVDPTNGSNGDPTKKPADKGKDDKKNEDSKSNENPKKAPPGKVAPPKQKEQPKRVAPKIIRTGELEFEVESFDPAVDTVQKLATSLKGYIATVNSTKLANGKVKGSVVIRVPPEKTYEFVKGVRKALEGKKGQLLGQRLGSKDITMQYTDIESRLRAARTMEERLIKIIKSGKGEIKDLLKAEKELGVWRTKIEEMEGELRYYSNLVSLATITITLIEREIQTAAKVIIRRKVDARIIVEEVEKARTKLEDEVIKAGGRISRSELVQEGSEQRNAILVFSVPPKSAEAVEKALRKLGTAVKFETKRTRETQGGRKDPTNQKGTQVDTEFMVVLYNLANVAPQEIVTVTLVVADVEETYRAIKETLAKTKARILKSERKDDKSGIGALFAFDVKRSEESLIRATLKNKERLSSDTAKRVEKTEDVTDTKVRYLVWVYNLNTLEPRETVAINLAAADVRKAHEQLRGVVDAAKAKIHLATLNEQDRRNITGKLYFTIQRREAVGLLDKIKTPHAILTRTSERAAASIAVTDSLVRYSIDFVNAANIKPRKTYVLGLQVEDVQTTIEAFTKRVTDQKGRVADLVQGKEKNGQTSVRVVYDVPLDALNGLVSSFKNGRDVRVEKVSQNPKAPDQELARGLIVVTVSNVAPLVSKDEGFSASFRVGLSYSLRALSASVTYLVVALLVVLPWSIVLLPFLWLLWWIFGSKKDEASASQSPVPVGEPIQQNTPEKSSGEGQTKQERETSKG